MVKRLPQRLKATCFNYFFCISQAPAPIENCWKLRFEPFRLKNCTFFELLATLSVRRNKILVPFCKCCVILFCKIDVTICYRHTTWPICNVMMSGWGIAALYLTRVQLLNSTSENPKVNSIYSWKKKIYKRQTYRDVGTYLSLTNKTKFTEI